jgi:hypothetical protein
MFNQNQQQQQNDEYDSDDTIPMFANVDEKETGITECGVESIYPGLESLDQFNTDDGTKILNWPQYLDDVINTIHDLPAAFQVRFSKQKKRVFKC